MPQQILNPEKYADRTVQDWHREVFPASHWAIDVDLMGACSRCRHPLYLIESTTNPNKPVSILRALAQLASVPALVIRHDMKRVLNGQGVWPSDGLLDNESAVHSALSALRAHHDSVFHNGAS